MTKTTFPALDATLEGWDAILETWRQVLLNGALPIYSVADVASLPAAASNTEALAFVQSPFGLYISDGATWTALGSGGSDAELLALAGLTSAANKLPYFTGSGTAALADFTAAARTVLDDASVSAMVDTLGGASATGSGGLVRATSPTLVTPALGTPSAVVLTNGTGLPGTTGLTGQVPVANGGTAASTASGARTNLGLGTSAVIDSDTDGTLAANSDTRLATQKAVKTYVDNLVAGLDWKASVKAATTAAGVLLTDFENGDTLDGVTLATGDRILIKDQASGAENGIYIVGIAGTPTRATDADSGTELVDATVVVEQGTVNADKLFTCTNDAITIGVTSIVFVAFGSAIVGALLATNNLSDVSNASTARTNLGLAIGTNVQAYDAELAAIAGLTSAADALAYFTGPGTAALTTLTAAARTLLDDTTVAAMVDTIGGASATGTGGLVRTTSPTLVTPALGTPSAVVLTNGTGLPLAGHVNMADATVMGNLSGGAAAPQALAFGKLAAILMGVAAALTAPPIVGLPFSFPCTQSTTSTLRYGAGAAAANELIVPLGYKLLIYNMSGGISNGTIAAGQTSTWKLYVDTVDQSSNFAAFQLTDSISEKSVETSSPGTPYVVDATSALKVVEIKVTNTATGGTALPCAATLWCVLIRP